MNSPAKSDANAREERLPIARYGEKPKSFAVYSVMKRTIRWLKDVKWQTGPGTIVMPKNGIKMIKGATYRTVKKGEETVVYVRGSNPRIISKPGWGTFPGWIKEDKHFEFLD
jgi:hypothetical protein